MNTTSTHPSLKRRKMAQAIAVLILLLLTIYTSAFLVIRSLAHTDFDLVVNGKPPRYAVFRYGLRDGGSKCYSGFGYEIWSLHQINDNPNGFITGTDLRFTCRGLFPYFSRWLVDASGPSK